MSKRKISGYFGSQRGNTSEQEEEKTENEFTPEEESREENDAQLSHSKPSNSVSKLQTTGCRSQIGFKMQTIGAKCRRHTGFKMQTEV